MARQYPSAYTQAPAASSEERRAIHEAFVFPPPLLQDQADQSITHLSLQPLEGTEATCLFYRWGGEAPVISEKKKQVEKGDSQLTGD